MQLKGRIKSWLQTMQEKQQEWMIVHVTLGQKTVRGELASKLQRTVFDKIRSDFNTKQNRCVQLRVIDESKSDTQLWEEFIVRLKESLINGFEQIINNYEDEIRKVDSRRLLPGWNYCNFFLLKVFLFGFMI